MLIAILIFCILNLAFSVMLLWSLIIETYAIKKQYEETTTEALELLFNMDKVKNVAAAHKGKSVTWEDVRNEQP